jgi:hypothetical protein
MADFNDRVESILHAKSLNELRSFILKIAGKVPGESQTEFLTLLENKRVVVSRDGGDFDAGKTLNRIRQLLKEVTAYNVEAYYYDDWHSDGYNIESDGGFCDEFYFCYTGAVRLLEHGLYPDAAEAFGLLFEIIEAFDEHNENNDGGEIRVETFINEQMLDIEMDKLESLRAYSTLMAPDRDLEDIFDFVFGAIGGYGMKRAFKDVLQAGSEPVPEVGAVLENWISYLYARSSVPDPLADSPGYAFAAEFISPLMKEAALLSGETAAEVMEKFVQTAGAKEPAAYMDLVRFICRDWRIRIENLPIHGGKRP